MLGFPSTETRWSLRCAAFSGRRRNGKRGRRAMGCFAGPDVLPVRVKHGLLRAAAEETETRAVFRPSTTGPGCPDGVAEVEVGLLGAEQKCVSKVGQASRYCGGRQVRWHFPDRKESEDLERRQVGSPGECTRPPRGFQAARLFFFFFCKATDRAEDDGIRQPSSNLNPQDPPPLPGSNYCFYCAQPPPQAPDGARQHPLAQSVWMAGTRRGQPSLSLAGRPFASIRPWKAAPAPPNQPQASEPPSLRALEPAGS